VLLFGGGALVLAALALGMTATTKDGPTGTVVLGAAAAASAALTRLAILLPSPPNWDALALTAFGAVWRLVMAGIIVYGILAYGLFGLDDRFRAAIRGGSFGAAVALVFFVVEQSLQDVVMDVFAVSAGLGVALGLAGAGAVALLIRPLDHWCRKLANRLVPQDPPRRNRRAQEIYAAARAAAYQDGVVTRRERAALRRLAEDLQLPDVRV
jgi:hypothetical protein